MLDQRQHPGSHEAGGPDRLTAPSQLGYLHHAPTGAHLNPPAGPGGLYLVAAGGTATGVDQHLDAVPSGHGTSVGASRPRQPAGSNRSK